VTAAPRVLEVFADVCCPFTHAGIHRLLVARAERHADVALVVRAWPLEWVNGEPLDPGHVAREVAALRAQVAPELFAGFDRSAFPPTSIPAFGLAAAAYDRGTAIGEAVSLALRDAVFEHGLDVAEDDVLATIGRAHGLEPPDEAWTRARVESDRAEGARRGVVGSPHFFVGGRGEFCPALRIRATDDGGFDVATDDARLAAFLDDAFGRP
jgi:predicted DsbA family dithiol-disulfide isomerase